MNSNTLVSMEQFIDFMKVYVGFASISSDKKFSDEVYACACWLQKYLQQRGCITSIVPLGDKSENTVIHATITADVENAPACLVYGHLDVQPAENTTEWKHGHPLRLAVADGRLFGRGVMDNKSQLAIHILTVLALKRDRKLKQNITFCIEAGEEIGSPLMADYILKAKEALRADYILISDGYLAEDEKPLIETGFRGCINFEINFRTALSDQHSGSYGQILPNAGNELAELVLKLNNLSTIPGFMNGVTMPTKDLTAKLRQVDEAKVLSTTGASALKPYWSGEGITLAVANGCMPSITMTGFTSGYTGEGEKNIVPATAKARMSVRTVPGMDDDVVMKSIEAFVKANTPQYVQWGITRSMSCAPVLIESTAPIFEEVKKILQISHGAWPEEVRVGGSIGVIHDFQKVLGVPILLVPLANLDGNMHGTDENMTLTAIQKGLQFSQLFFGV